MTAQPVFLLSVGKLIIAGLSFSSIPLAHGACAAGHRYILSRVRDCCLAAQEHNKPSSDITITTPTIIYIVLAFKNCPF
jgi:hypothetical protein